VGAQTAPVGGEAMVQGVHGELDESIREPAGAGPLVTRTRATTERGEGDAQRGPADRIEQPANDDTTVLTAAQLETPALDRIDVFVEHRRGIADVTGVRAVEGEAAHRVLEGERKQGTLVEAGFTSGALQRTRGPGKQGEVSEPDPPRVQRGHARRQLVGHRPGGDRARRRIRGHPALVADPVDRRRRALGDGFLGGGEGGGIARETEFEEVDPVAQPDQLLADLERRALGGRRG
jgi:hypothetical protein